MPGEAFEDEAGVEQDDAPYAKPDSGRVGTADGGDEGCLWLAGEIQDWDNGAGGELRVVAGGAKDWLQGCAVLRAEANARRVDDASAGGEGGDVFGDDTRGADAVAGEVPGEQREGSSKNEKQEACGLQEALEVLYKG